MVNGMWRACAGALLCVVGLAAEAAPGDWDHSFGVDGRVPLSVDVTVEPRVWKQQADGKIVTAGHGMDTPGIPTTDILIARFNLDGTPDTSLDGDGVLLVNLGTDLIGLDLDVLPDGRLLLAGCAGTDRREVRLLRFNRNGSPDTSFGTGGQVSLTDPRWIQNPRVALTLNGGAYLLAEASESTTTGIVVARVTADGALDTSFGSGGRAVVDGPFALRAGIVRSDINGALVMGGSSGPLATEAPFVARLTNTGQLDSSLGDNGIVVMPFLQGNGWVSELAIAADGKVLAAGERADANGTRHHFVARLNTNGRLDTGFGSSGRIVVPGRIHSMLLEPDGKLLLGGSINELWPQFAWLARYNIDGSPDVTFGLRGRSRVDFSLGASHLPAVLTHIQRDSDGSYRAVAQLTDTISPTFTGHFALARLVGSGANAGVIGMSGGFHEGTNQGIRGIVERAASYNITVYRTGGTDGTVSVQYRVVGESATAGQDFVADTGTVTFNDGETLKSLELRTLDDLVPESAETFYLELYAPTGGTSLSRSRINVQMESDGDRGSNISIAGPERALESAGSIRFLVQRTGDLRAPLAVHYATVAGTASAGTDFTAASGTVSWPANEGGVRAIDVTIADDAEIEADEQFSLALSSSDPIAVFVTSDPRATITVTDDDDAARTPTVTLKNTTVVVSEGASEVTFEAHRLGNPSQAVSATWATINNTDSSSSIARSGVDYTSASGELTWAAGDTSPKTFTVPIVDDAASELAESFGVNLSASYPAVTINGSAGAIIVDNDAVPTHPVISVGPAASFVEGVGNANITVTLTGVPGSTVNVSYMVEPETAQYADLLNISGTLTWAVGDSTPKQISIPITQDRFDEIDETFNVFLSNASGGAQIANSGRFTIIDDDPTPAGQSPPTSPGVQVSAVSVREGDRVARLTVSRTGSTDGALSVVCLVVSGTADAPADFIRGDYRLGWDQGETDPKQCEIQLNGDTQAEPDETFTVQLTPYLTHVLTAPTVTATITIVDDDGPNNSPARIDFVNTALSVNESATSVTLQVARSGNTAFASSVDYMAVAGTASTSDYAATSGTLTWDANDNSIKLITVTLTPDAVDEPDESFTVQLRNVSSGTELGAGSATVTIVDDDAAPSAPNPSGGGGGGGGGGGEESLITLLLWAALVRMRRAAQKGRR